MNNNFSIICNGQEYKDCWKDININMSIQTICNQLSVSTIDFFAGDFSKWEIKKGSKYLAKINNEVIGNGYIDTINSNYSNSETSFNFSGRDITCDLVDCPYFGDNFEFKNQTIKNIINIFCSYFNIQLYIDPIVETLVNKKIENYTIDMGRSASEQIVELCSMIGVLPISLGNGKLTITQTNIGGEICDDIILDNNVINGSMTDSFADRFSEYITMTDNKLDKSDFNSEEEWLLYIKNIKKISGKIDDIEITRKRPFVMLVDNMTSIEQCEKRSQYEKNIKEAQGLILNYELEGWTQVKSGKVWKPNKLVLVNDNRFNIKLEPMLITDVNLSYSDGFTTSLELVRPNCFSTLEG